MTLLQYICAFQQVMVRAYVRNLMDVAASPLLIVQLRDRNHRTVAGAASSYAAFAGRVKREIVKLTSTKSKP
jgi:hypothetical protein